MMEKLKYLRDILAQLEGIRFSSERLAISFPQASNRDKIDKIDSAYFEVENISLEDSEIDISDLEAHFYFDHEDFLARTDKTRWEKPTYLYAENILYYPETGESFRDDTLVTDYLLVENNHIYFKLLTFLKSHEHKEGSIFYFVDHFSWDSRIIVFTTLKKEGKLSISFPSNGLKLFDEIHLKENFHRLETAFGDASRNFPKFIKNELIGQLSKYHVGERINKLLEELVGILNIAEQNFEIYLHDLSIENLKKDFIDHKNKYFNQSREILSKLTNQAIGLPITIAASVFSTYKVSDSTPTLLVIAFVFSLYSCYTVFLLKLQKDDVLDLQRMFDKDYDQIKDSKFFQKFQNELDDFNTAKDQISSRFQQIILSIDIYYFLFCTSVTAFICYLIVQTDSAVAAVIATLLISGTATFLLYRFLFK